MEDSGSVVQDSGPRAQVHRGYCGLAALDPHLLASRGTPTWHWLPDISNYKY